MTISILNINNANHGDHRWRRLNFVIRSGFIGGLIALNSDQFWPHRSGFREVYSRKYEHEPLVHPPIQVVMV